MQATESKKGKLNTTVLSHFPRGHLVAVVTLSGALTVLLSLFPSENVAAKRHPQSVELALPPLPEMELEPQDDHFPFVAPQQPQLTWHEQPIQPGDNLSRVFKRAGVDKQELYDLLNTCEEAQSLSRLHPGHVLAFQLTDSGQLAQLRYKEDKLHSQLFSRTDDGFSVTQEVKKPDIKPAYREATIDSSLFLAGQEAKLDSELIMEMATIFGWDIDFALDIRQGDSFKVLYEELFLDGEKVGNGAILAAEFTNKERSFKAVRYIDKNGAPHYFAPNGRSMRKAFLRTPVELARISSHFNLKRKHPVLNTIRAHKGTDYAAARGTPIKATGDGKVVFAGRKGGYGNAVIIQHSHSYKTLYAHMNNFPRGIRTGVRVQQGQIIGYVGSTGLATGPHLHYEFYVNGRVRNPVKVELPQADDVARSERIRFLEQTTPLVMQMDNFHSARSIALADDVRSTIN